MFTLKPVKRTDTENNDKPQEVTNEENNDKNIIITTSENSKNQNTNRNFEYIGDKTSQIINIQA